ncbi:MAG: lipid kinase, partial [Chloroflexi bacterium]|nr:lipid kinase [Chloroflexota bacterium]
MRRMLVIWNGQAGGGDADGQSLVRDRLAEHGIEVEIFESTSEADARDRVRRALGDGLAAIVAAGGDGTVRPIALELVGGDTPLGILPLGTAMNAARALELPLELEPAIDVLATGRPRPIDVGVANGTPFLEVASIGLTADVLAGATAADAGRWRAGFELVRRAWRQPRTR